MGGEDDPPLTRKETEGRTSGVMMDNNQQLQDLDMVTFLLQQMEEERKIFQEEQAWADERWTKRKGQQQAQHAGEMKELAGNHTKQQVVVRSERHNTPGWSVEVDYVEHNAMVARMRPKIVGKKSAKVGRKSSKDQKDWQAHKERCLGAGSCSDHSSGEDSAGLCPEKEEQMKEKKKESLVRKMPGGKSGVYGGRQVGRSDNDMLGDEGEGSKVDNFQLSDVRKEMRAKKSNENMEEDSNRKRQKMENEVKKKKKDLDEQEKEIPITSLEEEETNQTNNLGGKLRDSKTSELGQKKVDIEGIKSLDGEGKAEIKGELEGKEGMEDLDVTVDRDEVFDLSSLDEQKRTENLNEVLCLAEVGGGYDVRFTAGYDHQAILDTGCSRSCASEEWTEAYIRLLRAEDRKDVVRKPSNNRFRFGDRKLGRSQD